jgi:AcrR family transcriptional regulator
MARLKSEEKRNAILTATAQAVAERGMGAPTSLIAKLAGVAEGSIFTYFADKDLLLNELYLSAKNSLRETMYEGYPSRAPIQERFEHVWNRYLDWGMQRPALRTAMAQLMVSERITATTRAEGERMFGDIAGLFNEGIASGALRPGQPIGFMAGVITAVAETSMQFMAHNTADADDYRRAGFEAIWRAIGSG